VRENTRADLKVCPYIVHANLVVGADLQVGPAGLRTPPSYIC